MLASKPTDPIDFQTLYQTVCDAASQNPVLVKTASKRLQEYLKYPRTSEQLQSIALEKHNVPLNVRQLAMIQFKNAVSSTWKNKRLFDAHSQATIRARALEFIFEEDNTIASCNTLIIAKIARSDVPSQWPSLIPELTNIIQTRTDLFLSNPTSTDTTNTLALKRTLHILDEVVEELSSFKLPSGIKTMANICETLYSPLVSYYDRLSGIAQNVISLSNLHSPAMQQPCEDLLLLFNMLFATCIKLMLWLWQKVGQPQFGGASETLSIFSQSSFLLFSKLFKLRKSLISENQKPLEGKFVSSTTPTVYKAVTLLTDHLLLHGSMFRRMQQLAIRRFVEIPGASDLVLYYWGEIVEAANGPSVSISDSFEALYPIPILVQGMIVFRSSLNAWSNKENTSGEVLSEGFLEEAVKILLTRFIPLDPKDLERWSSDPEEWINEEDKDEEAWEYRLRPCAERVLISLSAQYSHFVIPLLTNLFRHVTSVSSNDLSFVLQKEAVYCAIGLCFNRLQNEINFDEWMQKNLIPEAQETSPHYRIVKRRIAWIAGRWLADESRQASIVLVWQLLSHLLQDNSSDSAVRLSAAVALTQCLDTVIFDVNLFAPFVGKFVRLLANFLVETETLESKTKLLKTLNMTIERAEDHIKPHSQIILDILPGLWQASHLDGGSNNMFKSSLVVMMTHLTEACGPYYLSFFSIVISLIEECLTPQNKVFLEEDGLQLWLTAIRCAPSLTAGDLNSAGVIALFPRALTYITENLDMLGTLMMITESYIIADANTLLSAFSLQLFSAFRQVLLMAVKINTNEVIRSIGLIVQLSPARLWADAMHSSGLFACLVQDLIDDKDHYTLLKEYNYAFARMMLCDSNAFNQLVVQSAPALNMPATQVFEGLLDQWWAKFDAIAEPSNRKLIAMGVASWAATGRSEVLDRLYSEIFNLWLDVFGELKEAVADEAQEGSRSPLTTFWRNSKEEPDDLIPIDVAKTLEAVRRRQIFLQDPVNNVKLTVFVRENLQKAEVACGGTDILQTQYLAKADPAVLSQITAALSTGY